MTDYMSCFFFWFWVTMKSPFTRRLKDEGETVLDPFMGSVTMKSPFTRRLKASTRLPQGIIFDRRYNEISIY